MGISFASRSPSAPVVRRGLLPWNRRYVFLEVGKEQGSCQAQDAAEVVARDMRNRAQGLASGDLSVLAGGRRALRHPLRGGWSPSARALMGLLGTGMFVVGLTQRAPTACILGTVGLALAAEGATNVGLDDVACLSRQAAQKAVDLAGAAGERLGLGGEHREEAAEPAGARA
jgi:hypothetical protein